VACVDWLMMWHSYMSREVSLVGYTNISIDDVEYERIATLCVFSSHGDNFWEPLVRHECLVTIVLSIPKGIVEHRTSVHPVHAFTSICMA
jgi:hypothetical protein